MTRDLDSPGIERVVRRVCDARDIVLSDPTDTDYRWLLAFPFGDAALLHIDIQFDDEDDESDETIAVINDGPWEDITPDQSLFLADTLAELCTMLDLEAITFADWDSLADDLVARCRASRPEDELAVIKLGAVSEPFHIYPVKVRGELWIAIGLTLAEEDELDAEWAAKKNAYLTYSNIAWVEYGKRYELQFSFPLENLTAARFDHLIVDFAANWHALRDERGLAPTDGN